VEENIQSFLSACMWALSMKDIPDFCMFSLSDSTLV